MTERRLPDNGPARRAPRPPVRRLPDVGPRRDFGSIGGDPGKAPRRPDFGSRQRRRLPDVGPSR